MPYLVLSGGRVQGNGSRAVLPLTRHQFKTAFSWKAAAWPTVQASGDGCRRSLVKVVQMYKQNRIGNEMQVIAQYIASPFSVFCDSTEHSMQKVLPYTANCPGPLTLVEIRRNK